MRVMTLDDRRFRETCMLLEQKVLKSGFRPDIVIGIARGGVYVADCFSNDNVWSVVCQRGGTSAKKGVVSSVLKRLPAWMNSFLRCVESLSLELHDRFRNPEIKKPVVDSSLITVLKEGGLNVLVVDDAVDSGATLRNVTYALRDISANNVIRTAALTVTRKSPIVMPDYYLYHDRTLMRFPWSEDRR